MFRTVVVVAVLAAAVVPACTTNVVIVEQVVTSTSGDESPGLESTSTGEPEDIETTEDSTSTSTTTHASSTSTSTSTGEGTTTEAMIGPSTDTSTGAETAETFHSTGTGTTTSTPPMCGDGIVSDDEECDDGNQIDDDPCSNACVHAGCADGVQNQGESDIDCGGEWCLACSPGQTCGTDSDCFSQDCEDGACQAPPLAQGCEPAVVDAQTVYDTVVAANCTCHAGGSGGLTIVDASTLKGNTIGVPSSSADMPRVTPGTIDESYLLFKILGQQHNVPGGGGASMPLAGTLTDEQRCMLINWVASGAA
ncbi:DUF4215 domain-containing protein [Nannocystis pusilla]|uniref:DUF4215 domain-containing protein n=1 Tax=Nannocystis pusilla TaxID=889268 RepID=UPI003DA4DF48